MIELKEEDEEYYVFVNGKQVNISDANEDYVLAECDLTDLNGVVAHRFSKKLKIEVHSENRFSTYFFSEVLISCEDNEVALNFVCHTPNKYWEGRFGLAIFLHSVNKQVKHFDNFEVTDIETEEEWKGITIRRLLSFGTSIESGILNASVELKQLLNTAEIALGGIE